VAVVIPDGVGSTPVPIHRDRGGAGRAPLESPSCNNATMRSVGSSSAGGGWIRSQQAEGSAASITAYSGEKNRQ
jgi:hypothetical protein